MTQLIRTAADLARGVIINYGLVTLLWPLVGLGWAALISISFDLTTRYLLGTIRDRSNA